MTTSESPVSVHPLSVPTTKMCPIPTPNEDDAGEEGEGEGEEEGLESGEGKRYFVQFDRRVSDTWTHLMMCEFFNNDDLPLELSTLRYQVPVVSFLTANHQIKPQIQQLFVGAKMKVKELSDFARCQPVDFTIEDTDDNVLLLPVALRVLHSRNPFPFSLEWRFQSVVLPFIAAAHENRVFPDKDLLYYGENPETKAREIASIIHHTTYHEDFCLRNVLKGLIPAHEQGYKYHLALGTKELVRVPPTHGFYHQLIRTARELLDPEMEINNYLPNTIIILNNDKEEYWTWGADLRTWRRDQSIRNLLLGMVDCQEGWKTLLLLVQLSARVIEDRLRTLCAPYSNYPATISATTRTTTSQMSERDYRVTLSRYDGGSLTDLRPGDKRMEAEDTVMFGVYFQLFYVHIIRPHRTVCNLRVGVSPPL